MRTDGIGGSGGAQPSGAPGSTRPPSAPPVSGGEFTAHLQAQIAHRQRAVGSGIARVRAEIRAIRTGSVFSAPEQLAPSVSGDAALPPFTGDVADPYGWRAMTRQVGDALVAPGFGALFERQIQQESGYLPEVVSGRRRSSAGAEGIAQLMPQYYRWVDRTDPRASLIAGAQTMREHLSGYGGDLRKALAAYNAGRGRVDGAVARHGADWERGLPEETRAYLRAILGEAAPRVTVAPTTGAARRPGGT